MPRKKTDPTEDKPLPRVTRPPGVPATEENTPAPTYDPEPREDAPPPKTKPPRRFGGL